MNDTVLLQSGFATLALELIKWFIYGPLTNLTRLALKNNNFAFDIPIQTYLIMLPVLNLLSIPVLALVGFNGFSMPTDPVEFVREVLRLVIQSLISVLIYNAGVKPTQVAVAVQVKEDLKEAKEQAKGK